MMVTSMSRCKGCGEPILWIKSKKNPEKAIPCDPDLETILFDNSAMLDATISVVLENGQVIRGIRAAPGAKTTMKVEAYISHFDTCPVSQQFRKKEKAHGGT